LSAIARCSILGLAILFQRQESSRLRKLLARWIAILRWAVGKPWFCRDASGVAVTSGR
jgi:hypothetical protein